MLSFCLAVVLAAGLSLMYTSQKHLNTDNDSKDFQAGTFTTYTSASQHNDTNWYRTYFFLLATFLASATESVSEFSTLFFAARSASMVSDKLITQPPPHVTIDFFLLVKSFITYFNCPCIVFSRISSNSLAHPFAMTVGVACAVATTASLGRRHFKAMIALQYAEVKVTYGRLTCG
jgi:nitrate reductase gamma subunit